MAALHYENHEFDNSESIMAFLNEKDEGELYTQFSGVKIKYNTQTGEVHPISADPHIAIEITYSKELFLNLITLVTDAICLLAKYELLLQLMTLEDENLSQIIRKNHVDPESNSLINKNSLKIHQTLIEVLSECEPLHPFWGEKIFKRKDKTSIQKAVYDVLTQPNYDINHIYARATVSKIMEEIKNRIMMR